MDRPALRGSAVDRNSAAHHGFVPPGTVLPSDELVKIDAGLAPALKSLEGLDHGPARPVGAVVRADGSRVEFVSNEIILHAQTQAELDAFLARYGATVLRDGTPLDIAGADQVDAPASDGFYLLRIDPAKSALD